MTERLRLADDQWEKGRWWLEIDQQKFIEKRVRGRALLYSYW